MSIDTTEGKKWYVINTYSGYENKVKANLDRKVLSMGMENEIFNIVVPVRNEVENKNGKEKIVSHKIFPGYVLVEMIVSDKSWYVVRNTPGVTGFVGSGTKPIPLTDEEVENILGNADNEVKRELDIAVGEVVHINREGFKDIPVTVSEIDSDREIVKVIIANMFGRETQVEAKFSEIEKIL